MVEYFLIEIFFMIFSFDKYIILMFFTTANASTNLFKLSLRRSNTQYEKAVWIKFMTLVVSNLK